ncbi:MAG: chloride channel protein [Acidithiobacillus sp.]|nr:chloride channel protein [Acidithiobacillus sp.]
MPDHRRIHLLGCGVSAGIAAVFNAPLGGWFLAMEVIVPDWRPWTVLSTLVATTSASWVTQEGFGSAHLFAHATIAHWNGSLMTLISIGFIRLMDGVDAYSRQLLQNP